MALESQPQGPEINHYGTWKSEIDIDALTFASRPLKGIKADRKTGRIFALQARTDGSSTIYEYTKNETKELVPGAIDVRSSVHEYGGGAWELLPSGDIIFSNGKNDGVYVLPVSTTNSSEPRQVFNENGHRFADYAPHPTEHDWVVAVEEDHSGNTVINSLAYINISNGTKKTVQPGEHDFYTKPGFSPDGKKLTWLFWDHPHMPWTGAQLASTTWGEDNSYTRISSDSGPCAEPHWSDDGTLYFLQEPAEYRSLYKWKEGQDQAAEVKLLNLEEVEFGGCEWILGSNTYIFLTPTHVIAAYTRNATNELISINPETGHWKPLDLDIDLQSVQYAALAALTPTSFLVIGATPYSPEALYEVSLSPSATIRKLIDSTTENFPRILYSTPEHIIVPSQATNSTPGPLPVHAILYKPHNPKYTAPKDTKPPLIIFSHGGPTGHVSPGLVLRVQFWTSRGYAVLVLNYRGSDGYGRTYRVALNSHWGDYDVADAAACANYLSETGVVDGSRVGVRGGSAGGYLVLQAVCDYPEVFAGAVSEYGVSDLKKLVETTHKFESQYLNGLLFTPGMTEEEKEQLMRERSPLYNADKIRTPLLLLQGGADKVVPPAQAYGIRDAIEKNKGDVKLVIFPEEGHGFRNAKNIEKAVEEEMKWWEKTLVRRD